MPIRYPQNGSFLSWVVSWVVKIAFLSAGITPAYATKNAGILVLNVKSHPIMTFED